MDQDRLAKLRQRYAGAGGGEARQHPDVVGHLVDLAGDPGVVDPAPDRPQVVERAAVGEPLADPAREAARGAPPDRLEIGGAEVARSKLKAAIDAGFGRNYWPVIAKVIDA